MKETRRDRVWTYAGLFALALTLGVASKRTVLRREARIPAVVEAGEELRDAVASTARPTAGLAGRPVPTSWFKTPEQHRVEMDSALLSSRRRRAIAALK